MIFGKEFSEQTFMAMGADFDNRINDFIIIS